MILRGVWWVIAGLWVLTPSRAALDSELIISGLPRPVFVTAPPGDTNRLFVVEQHAGRIRIIDLATRTIKQSAFLVVPGVLRGSEQGLLGLAFHPNYATNGYFYLNTTVSGGGAGGHTEITRYRVDGDPATSDVADSSSKTVLLSFNQPEGNHNGGWIGFGPDGYLYIASGDGGGGNDMHGNQGNGQNRANLLGKILRVDVDNGEFYAIPDGNPFKGSDTYAEEIWAFGLRNPWRCSFDRATGDLWIGDVGQGAREEIDRIPAGTGGLNFGWRPREGDIQTPGIPNENPVTPAEEPVYAYPRSSGYSVTGGYVYRGTQIPELQGKYVFGDYGSGRIWELSPGDADVVREITEELNPAEGSRRVNGLSSFGEDGAGELYMCGLNNGTIWKIVLRAPPGISLVASQVAPGELALEFAALADQEYVLEFADSLAPGSTWGSVTNVPAGAERTVNLNQPVTGAERYFRVRTP